MSPRKGLLAVALAFLPLVVSGCTYFRTDRVEADISAVRKKVFGQSYAGASAKVIAIDEILTIKASGKATGNAYGFIQAPRELWAPFRWEVTAGRLDPDGISVGPGFYCTELDGKDTDPLEYYGICAQPVEGGLNVFVIRRGNSNVGQLYIPGANIVEFAVEADGESMIFQARIPGGGPWATVADIAFSDPGFGLLPSVGVSQMPADSQADFDFFRVVSNGTKPGATGEELAGEAAWKVVDALLEAGYALDDGADDIGGADAAYADAEDAVAAALALSGGIADEKARKGFTSKLGKVSKGLAKVRAKIAGETTAKTALKPVKGLVKNAALAAGAALDL